MTNQQIIFIGTLALIFCMSAVTFAFFLTDKKIAVSGGVRIKERTLLALTACFGSVGALVGRVIAHHKTEKKYFSLVIWFSLTMHALLVVYVGFLAFFL